MNIIFLGFFLIVSGIDINRMKIIFVILFIVIFTTNHFAQNLDKPKETLPVEMVYFFGSVVENEVELRWGTATEVNNYGYDVQRTDTSYNWIVIDFVQGYGNSYSPKDYIYYDSTIIKNGKYFYRLKQIDFDGNFELTHDTVKVTVDFITSVSDELNLVFDQQPESIILHQNFPNPFNPSTTISFSVKKNDHITLKIYTLSGEEVTTLWNRYTNIGIHYVKFNAANLSTGIYLYKLFTTGKVITKKLVITK